MVEVLTLGAAVHRLMVGVRRRRAAQRRTRASGRRGAAGERGLHRRTIGRYANRIAGGRFTLDGQDVEVRTHDRGNSLHGGPEGFDVRLWDVESHEADELVLSLVSPDGDQGFPGTVSATGPLPGRGTDRPGHPGGDDRRHHRGQPDQPRLLQPRRRGRRDDRRPRAAGRGRRVTPVDATGIPTGGHSPVAGTPFDFRTQEADRSGAAHRAPAGGRRPRHRPQLRRPRQRPAPGRERSTSPRTRTTVELWSDQPGLQVYTGNFLDGTRRSTSGGRYRQGDGVALEPQLFPDSPNRPEWPSATLRPGETYAAHLEWRFGTTT